MATPDTIRLLDPAQPAVAEPQQVSLVELIGVLAAGWRRIFGLTALAMAVMCGIAFLIPVSYTAQAVIMPPQQDQQSQAMMMGSSAMMGGLAGLTAVTGAGLLRNPAEMYIGILKSRTIADDLIRKFNLQKLYSRATMIDTRSLLARRTAITTGRDGLIYIRVDDQDRKRSAEMANAYVDELHAQGSRLALTSAAQRRVFFEQQLGTEKQALADAEVALKKMQQSSGLIYPSGQSEALIRSDAQLRAGIASREVQLQSMRMFATGENPQVQMLESELSEMRAQLAKIESGGSNRTLDVSARNLPETGLEYVRRLREVKYHETLFELLSRQYEAARIDEAKLAPVIQVVDAAVAPDKKSWPPRAIFVLAAGALALIGACFVALFQDHRRSMRPGR